MTHPSLQLTKKKPVVYTAFSKHNFFLRAHISKFVLEKGAVPLNPFMLFDYFLLDVVERDVVREANNNVLKKADELWVFGKVSDGVEAELALFQGSKRYFRIDGSTFTEITESDLEIE